MRVNEVSRSRKHVYVSMILLIDNQLPKFTLDKNDQ